LAADELITAIRIPKFSPRARFGFHKICRKAGEFADAIGVVAHDLERAYFSAVVGATGGRPLVVEMPEPAGAGSLDLRPALLKQAQFAGDAYDLKLHAVALKRAHDEARAA